MAIWRKIHVMRLCGHSISICPFPREHKQDSSEMAEISYRGGIQHGDSDSEDHRQSEDDSLLTDVARHNGGPASSSEPHDRQVCYCLVCGQMSWYCNGLHPA